MFQTRTVSILETLGQHTVSGAAYDSSQREYAPTCLPNTHTDVMSRIGDWLNETDTDADTNKDANHRPMCLLTGSAGLGKSTIAQTLAKDCADAHILAGSFFFSHSSNNTPQSSSSISKVVLTFAYQLAVSIPPAQDLIKDAFHADPSIPDKNLAVQFKKLIYQPLLAIAHLISPMVVIVDALDACEDRNGVVKLIEIITAAVLDPHKFPLRFFFTSRLEDHIKEKFEEQPTGLKTCRLALEDFRRFDETEEDEIARLSPRELVRQRISFYCIETHSGYPYVGRNLYSRCRCLERRISSVTNVTLTDLNRIPAHSVGSFTSLNQAAHRVMPRALEDHQTQSFHFHTHYQAGESAPNVAGTNHSFYARHQGWRWQKCDKLHRTSPRNRFAKTIHVSGLVLFLGYSRLENNVFVRVTAVS